MLTDEQWAMLEPLIEACRPKGRSWKAGRGHTASGLGEAWRLRHVEASYRNERRARVQGSAIFRWRVRPVSPCSTLARSYGNSVAFTTSRFGVI
jgi:hypothetical protein